MPAFPRGLSAIVQQYPAAAIKNGKIILPIGLSLQEIREILDLRRGGTVLADSGGHSLFLSPSIQWVATSDFLVEAAVQIPIVQRLNGTQLGTDWTAMIGVRHLFF